MGYEYLKTGVYSNLAKDILNAAVHTFELNYEINKKTVFKWVFFIRMFETFDLVSLEGELLARSLHSGIFDENNMKLYRRQLAALIEKMLDTAVIYQMKDVEEERILDNNSYDGKFHGKIKEITTDRKVVHVELTSKELHDKNNQTVILIRKPFVNNGTDSNKIENQFAIFKIEQAWILHDVLMDYADKTKLAIYSEEDIKNVIGTPRDPMQIEIMQLKKQEIDKLNAEYKQKRDELENLQQQELNKMTQEIKLKFSKQFISLTRLYEDKCNNIEKTFKESLAKYYLN